MKSCWVFCSCLWCYRTITQTLFHFKLQKTCRPSSEEPDWTSTPEQVSPPTPDRSAFAGPAGGGLTICSDYWETKACFQTCRRFAAPHAVVDSLFSSLRLRFIILRLFRWSRCLLWSLFLQIVCRSEEQRVAHKNQLMMREGCKRWCLCHSGELIKPSSLWHNTTVCFCFFYRGWGGDLFLLFAFNSLKPDTPSDIQTCMKNS